MRALFAMLVLAVIVSTGFLLMGCASEQEAASSGSGVPSVDAPAATQSGAQQSLEKLDAEIDITEEDLAVAHAAATLFVECEHGPAMPAKGFLGIQFPLRFRVRFRRAVEVVVPDDGRGGLVRLWA